MKIFKVIVVSGPPYCIEVFEAYSRRVAKYIQEICEEDTKHAVVIEEDVPEFLVAS